MRIQTASSSRQNEKTAGTAQAVLDSYEGDSGRAAHTARSDNFDCAASAIIESRHLSEHPLTVPSMEDLEFATSMERLRAALAGSRYLDGHETDWGQQFWAVVWERDGGTVLE